MSSQLPRELYLQSYISEGLARNGIYPAEVICTFCLLPRDSGLVSINMFQTADVKLVLKHISYNNLCDKSGILIDGRSIIFTGMGLVTLYSSLNN